LTSVGSVEVHDSQRQFEADQKFRPSARSLIMKRLHRYELRRRSPGDGHWIHGSRLCQVLARRLGRALSAIKRVAPRDSSTWPNRDSIGFSINSAAAVGRSPRSLTYINLASSLA